MVCEYCCPSVDPVFIAWDLMYPSAGAIFCPKIDCALVTKLFFLICDWLCPSAGAVIIACYSWWCISSPFKKNSGKVKRVHVDVIGCTLVMKLFSITCNWWNLWWPFCEWFVIAVVKPLMVFGLLLLLAVGTSALLGYAAGTGALSGRGLESSVWELDHSVWLDQLAKDFENSWLENWSLWQLMRFEPSNDYLLQSNTSPWVNVCYCYIISSLVLC